MDEVHGDPGNIIRIILFTYPSHVSCLIWMCFATYDGLSIISLIFLFRYLCDFEIQHDLRRASIFTVFTFLLLSALILQASERYNKMLSMTIL